MFLVVSCSVGQFLNTYLIYKMVFKRFSTSLIYMCMGGMREREREREKERGRDRDRQTETETEPVVCYKMNIQH